MIHFGDITKINGAGIPPVDIITGGSPCQDLSIAGKRAGLNGERSGLFMEQIRIIKEMRENERRNGRTGQLIRPRYMVWENVVGALSSNKGEDFRIVLEETARIADKDAVIPGPPRGGWTKAGCIMGDGWSIAWRVHDAQFWGVPQRRRRIALVADFGGQSAPEILFEPYRMYRNFAKSKEEGQGTSERSGRSTGQTGGSIVYGISSYDSNAMKSSNPHSGIYEAETARTPDLNGGSPACNQGGMAVVFAIEGNGSRPSHKGDGYKESEVMYTLNSTEQHAVAIENHPIVYDSRGNGDGETVPTITGDHENRITDYTALCMDVGFFQGEKEKSPALLARAYKDPPITYQEQTGPLMASGYQKNGTQEAANDMYVVNRMVRRLTPKECERLQGLPDGWTDIGDWTDSKGKQHKASDSPRYRALGNAMALPFWEWMAKRITEQYDEPPTIGSLFDGIGCFPLAFQRSGAETLWASEVDEFCIAVTKERFK